MLAWLRKRNNATFVKKSYKNSWQRIEQTLMREFRWLCHTVGGGPVYFNGKMLTDASTNMYTAYQVIFRMARRFECVCHFVKRLSSQDGRLGGASHWKSLSHPRRLPFLRFLSSRNRGITVTWLSYRSAACNAIDPEENSVNDMFILC